MLKIEKVDKLPEINSIEEYNNIKEKLKKLNGKYANNYIIKQLHDKENLRKVFVAVIKKDPARISDISEDAILSKQTCYSQLFALIKLNLVKRVYVAQVINGEIKNEAVKKKFLYWTQAMPESLKRYYTAVTSYFEVTNLGKQFAYKTYQFEQEFTEEEKDGRKQSKSNN